MRRSDFRIGNARRLISSACIICLCLLVFLSGISLAEAPYEPFIRIDGDDPSYWTQEVKNLRIVSGDRFRFGEADPKYGIDPSFVPSSEGLDTLCVSASAQYGKDQFLALADILEEAAGGREIWVFDLRRECHALLDGIPFSIYALHNHSNLALDAAEVEEAEATLFDAMPGTEITACPKTDDAPGEAVSYRITDFLTERELVEKRGFHYVRVPVTDHSWPEPEQVDAFVAFVKDADPEGTWLHFHCHAGKGRTVLFMIMYDKMRNPEVPMEDIVIRQTLMGGTYPFYLGDPDSYKAPYYAEKARMTRLFFRYVDENISSGYAVPWSEWLRTADALPDAA